MRRVEVIYKKKGLSHRNLIISIKVDQEIDKFLKQYEFKAECTIRRSYFSEAVIVANTKKELYELFWYWNYILGSSSKLTFNDSKTLAAYSKFITKQKTEFDSNTEVSYAEKKRTCNNVNHYLQAEQIETLLENYNYVAECVFQNEVGYTRTDKSYKSVYVVGKTQEEMLEAFFIWSNGYTYCNGTSLKFKEDKYSQAYRKHFFGEGGIENYARCGGNMD